MAKIIVYPAFCQITNDSDSSFLQALDQELSFKVQGAEYSKAYKGYFNSYGQFVKWDGRKRLLNNQLQFPIGLLQRVEDFYSAASKELELEDKRSPKSPNAAIDIIPALTKMGKAPYPYQLEAAAATLKKDHGILRLATGSGKCVSSNSIVLTEQGMLEIGDIGNGLQEKEVKQLEWNINTPLNYNNMDRTSHIYRDGYGETILVKTNYSYWSQSTPSHRVKILSKDGNIEWKYTKDIEENDVLVLVKNQKVFGNNNILSERDAYWLGLLFGDGCFRTKTGVSITNMDDHIIKYCHDYVENDLKLKLGDIPAYSARLGKNPKTRQLTLYSVSYRKKLLEEYEIGFDLSCDKYIPKVIMTSPGHIVAKFIRGLYETDGWIDDKENKTAICIGLSSKKLINQLHVILLNFGIVASQRVKKTTHKDCYILTIYREYIPNFIKQIGLDPDGQKFKKLNKALELNNKAFNSNTDLIYNQSKKLSEIKKYIVKNYGLTTFKKILNNIGIKRTTFVSWSINKAWRTPSRRNLKKFICELRNNKINSHIIDDLEKLCSDDFYYDLVKSKEKTFTDNYDFVVPTTNSFVAQGFINHNTLVSALITANFGKTTILYVIGTDLLYQFHNLFSKLFDQKIGLIGDGHCDIQDINIVSVWTAGQALGLTKNILLESSDENKTNEDKYKDIRDLLKRTKVHIFDEAHVAAAQTIQTITDNINPEHIYGMSASPWRDDGADLLIEARLGKYLVNISATTLIEGGYLVKPVIRFINIPNVSGIKKHYQTIYKHCIVENEERNNHVAKGTKSLVESGFQTLVLYNSIAHGEILHEKISKILPCALLSGKDSMEVRNKVKEDLESKKINCIIASRIFDIGVDLPSLSGLVNASSGKSSVRALQRIGRVIRKYPGKTQANILDFADQSPFIKDHAKERYRIYCTEKGFKVIWPS